MAKFGEPRDMVKCSFCGKTQKQVGKLIGGPGVSICNECVDLCNDIIEDEGIRSRPPEGPTSSGETGASQLPGRLDAGPGRRLVGAHLAADLQEWTHWDVAAHALGRLLGLFEDKPFPTVQEVFWTDNHLGNGLHDALLALVRGGVLDRRIEPDEQFRWRGDAP